jgi:hypothetical protein
MKLISQYARSFSLPLILLVSGFIVTNLIGRNFGPVLQFFLVVFLVSPHIPSRFEIQKLAVTATLIVGLSPIYLLARGLVTKDPLNSADFNYYLLLFFVLSTFTSHVRCFREPSAIGRPQIIRPFSALSSLTGFLAILALQVQLRNRSLGDSIAWVAGGDSKEHLVNAYSLINYGHLNPISFLTQPSSSPSYLSLVFSQLELTHTDIELKLLSLLQAYSMTWILLIGILCLSFAAAMDVLWRLLNPSDLQTPKVLLATSSLIPLFSFSLGPALTDGFFTAIFGIAAVVTLLIWFIEVFNSKNVYYSQVILGVLIFATSVMGWMFVIPFTAPILLLGIRNLFKKFNFKSNYVDPAWLSLIATSLLLIHFSEIGQEFIQKSKVALSTSGAVNATDTQFYISAISLLALLGLISLNRNRTLGRSLLVISALEIASLIAFKKYSNLSVFSWNYYLIKYQWIMLVALLALIFTILLMFVYTNLPKQMLPRFAGLAFVTLLIFTLSETLVNTNSTWKRIWDGWQNPRGVTIEKLLEQDLDEYNPTMFFHFGYGGDDQLGNFWLNAFINPVEPIKGWNYTIDTTGDPSQLCGVNYFYPSITVITSDMKLEEKVLEICPNEDFTFKLEPSPI